MTGHDTRRYEMLVRVRDFGDSRPDLFAPDSIAGQAFASVGAAVANLATHAATQESGRGSTREGTASKAVAREALREDLEAIVRTARAMAVTMAGMDDRFRPPRGSDQHLLNSARACARDAAPLAQQFIAHYLPEDFLEDLEEDIKAFEAALRDQNAGKGTSTAATAAIDAAMEQGLSAITRLEAFVPNRLRHDPGLLAAWDRARRVSRRPRSEPPAGTGQPGAEAAAGGAG